MRKYKHIWWVQCIRCLGRVQQDTSHRCANGFNHYAYQFTAPPPYEWAKERDKQPVAA